MRPPHNVRQKLGEHCSAQHKTQQCTLEQNEQISNFKSTVFPAFPKRKGVCRSRRQARQAREAERREERSQGGATLTNNNTMEKEGVPCIAGLGQTLNMPEQAVLVLQEHDKLVKQAFEFKLKEVRPHTHTHTQTHTDTRTRTHTHTHTQNQSITRDTPACFLCLSTNQHLGSAHEILRESCVSQNHSLKSSAQHNTGFCARVLPTCVFFVR